MTLAASAFLEAAAARGIGFYTGVPCSFLTPLINRVASDRGVRYVGAASEGEAVAIAAGAWLAGEGTAVMCQNSGLGNAVNPLTSLNAPFRIPTLLVVTWRGAPGLKDEPQHEVMGRITQDMLRLIEVEQAEFPAEPGAIGPALDRARAVMGGTGLPYAFVMRQGTLAEEALDEAARVLPKPGERVDLASGGERPGRVEVLGRVLAVVPDTLPIVVTTGKAGRELFTLADREQHFYQVGSMGCAGPMGLGIGLVTGGRVLVLDGDGAALMKMGAMATVGAYAPRGMVHVVLDNGVHDSTGGQMTVSASVDFAGVALACGYRRATTCDGLAGFEQALTAALAADGPALVHVRIKPGSMSKLGRPTVAPHEVAQRFRAFLAGR